MIRVLDGKVRTFLSDRYCRLDNLELCAAVLPVIQEMNGLQIESCEVMPTHLYLKVINRRLKAEVRVGDVVQAGFVVSNSEVGLGSLRVEPLVFRLVCKNGLICKELAQRKYHVGRQVNASVDFAYELYLKVQDVVRAAVDEAKFMLTVDKLREATQIPLKHDPVKSVELLADKFQLTENERGDILRQLFIGIDIYKIKVDTGEVYKSGLKKGQPKLTSQTAPLSMFLATKKSEGRPSLNIPLPPLTSLSTENICSITTGGNLST